MLKPLALCNFSWQVVIFSLFPAPVFRTQAAISTSDNYKAQCFQIKDKVTVTLNIPYCIPNSC